MDKLCDTKLKARLLPHAESTSVIHMPDSKSWYCRLGAGLAQLPPQGCSWICNGIMKANEDVSAVMEQ